MCVCVLFCCRQLAAQVFVGCGRRKGQRGGETRSCGCLWRALPHFELELKVCCCCCSMRSTLYSPFLATPTNPSANCLCRFHCFGFVYAKKQRDSLLLCLLSVCLSQSLGWPNTHTHTHSHKSLTSCRHSGAPERGVWGRAHLAFFMSEVYLRAELSLEIV